MPDENLKPDLSPPWKSALQGVVEAGVYQGAAMQGAAMSNMMTSHMTGARPPGIAEGFAKGAEAQAQRLREEWDQDMTRKFQAMYGEDSRRQSEELSQQHDMALRIVDIPPSEADLVQDADPDGAPTVPEKGYEVVNPVTGEVQHIRLGTPEARSHFKKVTSNFHAGQSKLVMEYMDAAAQYPNSPGIQRLAENMFNHMTQSIEAEKDAQLMAVREQQMQESDARMAEAEDEKRRRGMLEEEQAGILRERDPEGTAGLSNERLAARSAAEAGQEARDAKSAQNQGLMAEADAEIARGMEVAEEQGITKELPPEKYRELAKVDEATRRRQREDNAAAMSGKEPMRPTTQLETIKSVVMGSDQFASRLKNVGGLAMNTRHQKVQEEIARRLKLIPPADRAVQHGRIETEVEAEIPQPNIDQLQSNLLKNLIEVQVRNSPQWQEDNIYEKGYDGVEDALGKAYPDMYPEWVKADKERPLSATNNVAYQRLQERQQAKGGDKQAAPPPPSKEKKFQHFQEGWAAPTPEQVQTAIKLADESRTVEEVREAPGLLAGMGAAESQFRATKAEKMGLGLYSKHVQVLEGALIEKQKLLDSMALEQVNPETSIASGAYDSQIEQLELSAERIQQAYDTLVEQLPLKQRQAKIKAQQVARAKAGKRAAAAREAVNKLLKEQGVDVETEETKKYVNEVIKNPKILREMGIK